MEGMKERREGDENRERNACVGGMERKVELTA